MAQFRPGAAAVLAGDYSAPTVLLGTFFHTLRHIIAPPLLAQDVAGTAGMIMLGSTMVPVSTVQPSLNLEFLCTYKNFKKSLYTLFEK